MKAGKTEKRTDWDKTKTQNDETNYYDDCTRWAQCSAKASPIRIRSPDPRCPDQDDLRNLVETFLSNNTYVIKFP